MVQYNCNLIRLSFIPSSEVHTQTGHKFRAISRLEKASFQFIAKDGLSVGGLQTWLRVPDGGTGSCEWDTGRRQDMPPLSVWEDYKPIRLPGCGVTTCFLIFFLIRRLPSFRRAISWFLVMASAADISTKELDIQSFHWSKREKIKTLKQDNRFSWAMRYYRSRQRSMFNIQTNVFMIIFDKIDKMLAKAEFKQISNGWTI